LLPQFSVADTLSYNAATDLIEPSKAVFEVPPPAKTRIVLEILEFFRLTRLERAAVPPEEGVKTRSKSRAVNNGSGNDTSPAPASTSKTKAKAKAAATKGGDTLIISATNLTILNFLLVHFGPMHERSLNTFMAGVQVACSALAFVVRYGVGSLVYGGDRR
jgi:UDP-N-acetylglucosamine--dolichyl-phosphate N-acetylglucosaminephosphotransferase